MNTEFSDEVELIQSSSSPSLSPGESLMNSNAFNQVLFESNFEVMTNELLSLPYGDQNPLNVLNYDPEPVSPIHFNSFSYPFEEEEEKITPQALPQISPVTQQIFTENQVNQQNTQHIPPLVSANISVPSLIPKVEEKKKRKRILKGESISVACQLCRQKHTRCDGQKPCSTCKKSKADCVYLPRQRKKIHSKINKTKTKSLKLEEQVPEIVSPQIVKPNLIQEEHLNIASDVFFYLSAYRLNVEPFFPISSSLFPTHYLLNKDAPANLKFVSNALLACGALSMGDTETSTKFIDQAKSLLPLVFELSDLYTASGFSLLSSYYSKFGQFEKGKNYSSVARSISEVLRKDKSANFYAHIIFCGSTLQTVKNCDSRTEQLKLMTNIATELTKLEQTILITGSDKIRFNFYKSLIIIWKFIVILVVGVDQQSYPKIHFLINLFEELSSKFSNTPLKDIILSPLTMRAFVFYKEGRSDLVRQHLSKIADDLLQCRSQFPGLLFVLCLSCVLNLKLGNSEAIKKNLIFASNYEKFFPIIPQMMESIFRDETFRDSLIQTLLTHFPSSVCIDNSLDTEIIYDEIDQLSSLIKSISVS